MTLLANPTNPNHLINLDLVTNIRIYQNKHNKIIDFTFSDADNIQQFNCTEMSDKDFKFFVNALKS